MLWGCFSLHRGTKFENKILKMGTNYNSEFRLVLVLVSMVAILKCKLFDGPFNCFSLSTVLSKIVFCSAVGKCLKAKILKWMQTATLSLYLASMETFWWAFLLFQRREEVIKLLLEIAFSSCHKKTSQSKNVDILNLSLVARIDTSGSENTNFLMGRETFTASIGVKKLYYTNIRSPTLFAVEKVFGT